MKNYEKQVEVRASWNDVFTLKNLKFKYFITLSYEPEFI